MKAEIHPQYTDTTITCACGAVYQTRSTKQNIRIGICAACHPFYTGLQKFVDTAGRVEKFNKRFNAGSKASDIKQAQQAAKPAPKAKPAVKAVAKPKSVTKP